jgi:hypothetical protein
MGGVSTRPVLEKGDSIAGFKIKKITRKKDL